jgi:carbamoyltransferase
MINTKKFEKLFGFKMRNPEAKLSQVYCDLALAIQEVTEEIILKLAKHAQIITGEKNLCLAGGVALNCVANSRLKRENIFSDIWIQPASGDAGGALGAALAYYYSFDTNNRETRIADGMKGSFLGPSYTDIEIIKILRDLNIHFSSHTQKELCDAVSARIDLGEVVGWFQGKMEFGPRALGSRSILADARSPEMQKKLNLKIKYREGFRPFAPSCLLEDTKEYFVGGFSSPYMLLIDHIRPLLRSTSPENHQNLSVDDRLYFKRSPLPAITHLDYSARLQTVDQERNPLYHKLISAFKARTGCGMIVNTSFNVRGEPIVCMPIDALKCFFQTEMDVLAIGTFLIEKKNQLPEVIKAFQEKSTVFTPD